MVSLSSIFTCLFSLHSYTKYRFSYICLLKFSSVFHGSSLNFRSFYSFYRTFSQIFCFINFFYSWFLLIYVKCLFTKCCLFLVLSILSGFLLIFLSSILSAKSNHLPCKTTITAFASNLSELPGSTEALQCSSVCVLWLITRYCEFQILFLASLKFKFL